RNQPFRKFSPAPVPVLWVPLVVEARTASLAYGMPGSGKPQSRRESFRTHTPCTSTRPAVAQALQTHRSIQPAQTLLAREKATYEKDVEPPDAIGGTAEAL